MSTASDVRDANPKSKGDETKKPGGGRKILAVALAVEGVALAAFLLHRIFREYSWQEFQSALASAPKMRLAAAIRFAAASYLCVTFFDWLASRYAGFSMPWRRAAHASFTALSLGHNIGFAALSSGAVRYRFYTLWGMSREGVAKVILFCGATVALGLLTLIGFTFLLRSADAATITGLSESAAMARGATALALVPGANLIAALIVFRASYFFIPFVFGLATIAITELYWRARGAKI